MALQAVITALQDLVGAIDGIRIAPHYAPEAPEVFPASVCLPYEGETTGIGGNVYQNIDTVTLDIHVGRRDMKWDVRTLTPYVDSISNMLAANPTISDKASAVNIPRCVAHAGLPVGGRLSDDRLHFASTRASSIGWWRHRYQAALGGTAGAHGRGQRRVLHGAHAHRSPGLGPGRYGIRAH